MALQERTCSKEPSELTCPDPPFTLALMLRPNPSLAAPIQPVNSWGKWKLAISARYGSGTVVLGYSSWIILPSSSLFRGIRHVVQFKASPCLPVSSPLSLPGIPSGTSLALWISSWCPLTGGSDANKSINQYSSGLFYWKTKQKLENLSEC